MGGERLEGGIRRVSGGGCAVTRRCRIVSCLDVLDCGFGETKELLAEIWRAGEVELRWRVRKINTDARGAGFGTVQEGEGRD